MSGWCVDRQVVKIGDRREVCVSSITDSLREPLVACGHREHQILCEAYAHIGFTRGGQPHKIAKDILKMLAAEKRLDGQWRKILCFADPSAARCVNGHSWLAAVRADLGVEVKVFLLPADLYAAVVAAQQRQVMVNPL